MQPTDVSDPRYFHKVVDCQWACPAHTNIPEYIRLIAQGRFTESYLLNRQSNVFPGILGRTCDRPCEPACRRGRVDGKPVAICRLKRVAADYRDDVTQHAAQGADAEERQARRARRRRPASLTVANDLAPLGYAVTIFEKLDRPGGLMRTNIPSFRLPAKVLDEECRYILDMGGIEIKYSTPVESLKSLLDDGGFDAVFIGSGAPRGKNLDIPGRYDSPDHVHIGIDWLESIHFGHTTAVGKDVLIIGVGNTAMDCCRSAKRLGATGVRVIGRKPRKYFKASPWELEDAEEEKVDILEDHSPVRFVYEGKKLVGMEFERFRSIEVNGKLKQEKLDNVILPGRRRHPRHRPGERVPLDRARHRHRVQGRDADRRQDDVHVDARRRLLRRRRGVGPGEHHLGGRARAPGGHLDPQPLPGRRGDRAAGAGTEPGVDEDGPARVVVFERLLVGGARQDGARRSGQAPHVADDRGRARLQRRADHAPRSSAASTATCRPASSTSCASSATRASTSARWTA